VTAQERQPEGALVVDTGTNKLGYVMGHEGPYVQLRPVTGGREWDADPSRVRPATEDERLQPMREHTRAMNSFSSGVTFR
jgi:hypothetical protein